jgi:hypothetical protein
MLLADRVSDRCDAPPSAAGDATVSLALASSFVRKCRRVQQRFAASEDGGEDVVASLSSPTVAQIAARLEGRRAEWAALVGSQCAILTAEIALLTQGFGSARRKASARLAEDRFTDNGARTLVASHSMAGVVASSVAAHLAQIAALATAANGSNDAEADTVETGAVTVSLRDPLSMTRIATPARHAGCSHAQPFDLDFFLQSCARLHRSWLEANMAEAAPSPGSPGRRRAVRFKCPVCDATVAMHDVYGDAFVASAMAKAGPRAEKLLFDPAVDSVTVAEEASSSDDDSDDDVAVIARPSTNTPPPTPQRTVDGTPQSARKRTRESDFTPQRTTMPGVL